MELDRILDIAIQNGASDIHLAVGLPPIVRVNGSLLRMNSANLENDDVLVYARQLLSEKLYEDYMQSGECDASYYYLQRFNFRVNVFRQKGCCGIVMRLIPSKIPSIDSLKLPEVFKSLCMKRRGLILVTGPTGSGKTTTLAAMIDYMSRVRNEHIITIEDPVEYVFSHGGGIVNQRQLGTDTESFDKAIRSALREDIDIIMVGEMRDLATISAAVTAAETGHLVLSTLHTVGASKTIDRIIDVYPADQQTQIRVQLSTVLEAVISQQLVPNRLGNGRALALEVMIADHAIQNLIREGKNSQIQNQIQLSRSQGMISMDASLVNLYRSGQIDEQNMIKYCADRQEIKRLSGI